MASASTTKKKIADLARDAWGLACAEDQFPTWEELGIVFADHLLNDTPASEYDAQHDADTQLFELEYRKAVQALKPGPIRFKLPSEIQISEEMRSYMEQLEALPAANVERALDGGHWQNFFDEGESRSRKKHTRFGLHNLLVLHARRFKRGHWDRLIVAVDPTTKELLARKFIPGGEKQEAAYQQLRNQMRHLHNEGFTTFFWKWDQLRPNYESF